MPQEAIGIEEVEMVIRVENSDRRWQIEQGTKGEEENSIKRRVEDTIKGYWGIL